jgi:hypothetical protein
MKKTLVILLALVMVFAFASTALAADTQYTPYTDIAAQDSDTQTAIERLSVLGALKGYNAEGTIFAPGNNITREEFATIGVRIAGLEDQVALYASLASAFTDVEEGRWSEGYINCANANGIMVGRGGGLFDPKANVTMQEVATVLLRAVGYTDQLPGAWPTDYNVKAVNVGLTEYVDYIGPKYATRGEVAAMVNEALDLWIVFYVDNEFAAGLGLIGWDEADYVDEDGFAYKLFKTNEGDEDYSNLLYETFGAYTTVAQFEDMDDRADNVIWSEISGWGFDNFDDWELLMFFRPAAEVQVGPDDWDPEEAVEVASLYGISDGGDLTDLGFMQAVLTVFDNGQTKAGKWVGDEICYVDFTSTVDRMTAVDDDYNLYWGDALDESDEDYGEVWFDEDGDAYAAKDFSRFESWPFGIVDSADAEEVTMKDDWYGNDIDVDDPIEDGVVFYLFGEGFVDAADLQENDVIWYPEPGYVGFAQAYQDSVMVYLVTRPAEGTLDDYGTDFIEFDDVDYYDWGSAYSIDKGANIESFVTTTVGVDFSDTIFMAQAYDFINFAYFYDDVLMYQYGVLDSYIIGDAHSKQYVFDTNNEDEVTGMNVLLPGDTELTEIAFEEAVDEDFFNSMLPREGSLIEYSLNSDGECIAVIPDDGDPDISPEGPNITDGHDWYQGFSGPQYLADPVGAVHGSVTGEWTSKGRLALAGPGIDDTYTFTDDAVIYLVSSVELDEPGPNPIVYDFDTVECLTYDDFKALGDFSAYVCLYTLDGRDISVMWVRDIEEDADTVYGFGLFTGAAARSISLDAYYMEIGGKVVLVDEAVFDDLYDEVGLIAYMTSDGVVEDGDWLLFDDDALNTQASINAYYAGAWYDELEMEIDLGDVYGLPTNDDITFDNLYYDFVTPSITLFFEDMVESFDYDTSDAVDFEDVVDNDYAVFVYDTATENDLLYLLLGPGL